MYAKQLKTAPSKTSQMPNPHKLKKHMNDIAARLMLGEKQCAIAAHYQVDPSAICYLAKKMNIGSPVTEKKNSVRKDEEAIMKYVLHGFTYEKIAREFHITGVTVSRIARRHGIIKKNRRKRHLIPGQLKESSLTNR